MADNIHTTTVVDANAWDQLMQMDAPANSPVSTTVAGVAPIQTWSEMEQVLPDIGDVDNKILAAAGFSNTILISTTTAEVLETITVSIGENGNWFVGTEDTGVPAVGTDATTMPKASGLYTAAALTQAGTQVTLVAGTEYCVKVGASYGSFVVLADTLITLSADTMILTIDNAGAIRQYPLGTNANIIPPSEALVGIAMSGSGGTAKFEAPTVHQAWIVASLAKPFSELAQQAAINANLSAVNAQEAADSAAQSEIIVSQNVSIAQEWAESPEDDPISTSPFSFSALHWAMKSQKFAQVAGSELVWYGGWDASGNLAPPTPAVGSGAPFYRITGAGTINTVAYAIGDYIHWDTIGLGWFKIDGTDSVVSVNGKSGVVVLNAANVGAAPAGFGLGSSVISTITDFNLYPSGSGFYLTPDSGSMTNKPSHGAGRYHLLIQHDGGSYIKQIASNSVGSSITSERVSNNNGATWTAWSIVYSAENKPTTAEIGAAPDGFGLGVTTTLPLLATFLSSTNATGWYLAFGDLVPTNATPGAPIGSGNSLLTVYCTHTRTDVTHYLVLQNTVGGPTPWYGKVDSGAPTTIKWNKGYAQNSILGAVSQASGVPTGAIIERGSNANGEYIKFADGAMICTRYLSYTANITTATGSIFSEATSSAYTYAASFSINRPIVTAQGGRAADNNIISATILDNGSQIAASLRMCNTAASAAVGVSVFITAIGRWV